MCLRSWIVSGASFVVRSACEPGILNPLFVGVRAYGSAVTLIVAVATGNYAIHASDRYVSVQRTPASPGKDWDLHANKTVVAIGSDCWLVLGYSGLAYLDGKPTDQLIAEAITGYEDLSSGGMSFAWCLPKYPHYREIRDRIEKKLTEAYSRLPADTADAYATHVLGSGIQRKNNLVSGVMFGMTVQGNASHAMELLPRRLRNQFNIYAVGSVDKPAIDKAKNRIETEKPSNPDDIREILMDAVSETSALTDAVGDDVMGVVLDKPKNTIRTLFRRADPQRQAGLLQLTEHVDERFKQMSTVSTPYVLTPGISWGPSIGNPGGWTMVQTGIKFEYSGFGFDPPKQGGGFMTAQPRKPPP